MTNQRFEHHEPIVTPRQPLRNYLGSLSVAAKANEKIKAAGSVVSDVTDRVVGRVLDETPDYITASAVVAGATVYGAGLIVREAIKTVVHDVESVVRGAVHG